ARESRALDVPIEDARAREQQAPTTPVETHRSADLRSTSAHRTRAPNDAAIAHQDAHIGTSVLVLLDTERRFGRVEGCSPAVVMSAVIPRRAPPEPSIWRPRPGACGSTGPFLGAEYPALSAGQGADPDSPRPVGPLAAERDLHGHIELPDALSSVSDPGG